MKPSRTLNIKDYFVEIGVDLEQISLGEFDTIGEFCVKRQRDPNSELYRRVGAFFKPNQERMLLVYSLIKRYRLNSFLEVGFGRGASSLAAAKAFHELGNDGKVMSIDPNIDDNFMRAISQVFPQEWLGRIQIARGSSRDVLPQLRDRCDLLYIDGDHTKDAVLADWNDSKNLWSCFCLLDDYHMDPGNDPGIQVHEALDEVEQPESTACDLIRTDRRIFLDDRQWPDEKVRYGQLLLTRPSELENRNKEIAFKESWDW